MAKLKRSIFIGLGGTGANAILHTKKRFMDAFDGKIPPMIGFLVIDTDQETKNKIIYDRLGNTVQLEGSEFVYSQVMDPLSAYKKHRDTYFKWYPEENVRALSKMVQGAGQIRSNGRFSLVFNHQKVFNATSKKLNEILDAQNLNNYDFELNGEGLEVNFVFSVGGGTGSGTFIDISYIVNSALKAYNIDQKKIAFLVMPDVFHAMGQGPGMKNIYPNGYGALKDLDYLMHLDPNSNPLSIKYEQKELLVDKEPYDVVFTVNNKNLIGNVYQDVSDLSELIGMAMFTGASELSGKAQSSYDNVETVLASGALNVQDKKAWACGLGLSELHYDGNKLANIYVQKAIKFFCDRFISLNEDVSKDVDFFIDKDTVKIRENGGDENDDVIDALLPREPRSRFFLDDNLKEARLDIDNYLSNIEKNAQVDVKKNYGVKISSVEKEVGEYVKNHLNTQNGVGYCLEFCKQLNSQLSLFLNEMESEKKEIEEGADFLKQERENVYQELETMISGFFAFARRKQANESKKALEERVFSAGINIHEKYRRDYAIDFFNRLARFVNDQEANLERIKAKLNQVSEIAILKAHKLQSSADDKNKSFVIELHKRDLNSISVEGKDLDFDSFLMKLTLPNKITSFFHLPSEEISTFLFEYIKGLPKVLSYVNTVIDDVLDKMDKSEIQKIFNDLRMKSEPLWALDFQGHILSPDLHSSFIIGVPNESTSCFVKDKDLLSDSIKAGEHVNFSSTRVNDKISLYRMVAAAPIFAVNNTPEYKKDYSNSVLSHHVDAIWKTKMDREDFDVFPKQVEDNSIEIWVKSFIYGFVRLQDGVYEVKSFKEGSPRRDYWFELSSYRDEALEQFIRLGIVDEVEDMVKNELKSSGTEDTIVLYQKAANKNIYFDEISLLNIESNELDKKEYTGIAKLIDKEIDFVKKELLKGISA